MRVRVGLWLPAALLQAGLATSVGAQAPVEMSTSCPVESVPLPAALSGWASRRPVQAGADRKGLAAAAVGVGEGAQVALLATPAVRYPSRPEKPGGSVSHGGLLSFSVATAGTYRVALGSGAWIDVLRGGKALESIAHGHGPACSGIMKMVDFTLKPGRYVLQISANAGDTLPLLVARLD